MFFIWKDWVIQHIGILFIYFLLLWQCRKFYTLNTLFKLYPNCALSQYFLYTKSWIMLKITLFLCKCFLKLHHQSWHVMWLSGLPLFSNLRYLTSTCPEFVPTALAWFLFLSFFLSQWIPSFLLLKSKPYEFWLE